MPELKTNIIYRGDCAKVLANHVPDGTIDLIYVDPPFFSNEQYEVLWRNGYEMRAFEDRWKGGIENYISWMEPKLRECYRVLKSTGTFYLHCDWHANYRLRMMLDEIFGLSHFQNEIIWKRTTAHVDWRYRTSLRHPRTFRRRDCDTGDWSRRPFPEGRMVPGYR